jgi:hypothetical protein
VQTIIQKHKKSEKKSRQYDSSKSS